jgi:hypothetical protein
MLDLRRYHHSGCVQQPVGFNNRLDDRLVGVGREEQALRVKIEVGPCPSIQMGFAMHH